MASLSGVIEFKGHPMIRATHPTTLEVTKDDWLTSRGDCVVGTSANMGLADLPQELKEAIRSDTYGMEMTLQAAGRSFKFMARGDPRLTLSSRKDVVIRRSSYACERTLAVMAEAAAEDIPRMIVRSLQDETCVGTLKVEVKKVPP